MIRGIMAFKPDPFSPAEILLTRFLRSSPGARILPRPAVRCTPNPKATQSTQLDIRVQVLGFKAWNNTHPFGHQIMVP